MLLLIGILMIIFDLDTLSDDTHRRHFIDPKYNPNYKKRMWCNLDEFKNNKYIADEYIPIDTTHKDVKCGTYSVFKPDYDAYNAACGDDVCIQATWKVFIGILDTTNYKQVQIWSSRCQSTLKETEKWLCNNLSPFSEYDLPIELKMRPIGNTEPAHILKERWFTEISTKIRASSPDGKLMYNTPIDFVFDADPDSIAMFRRRGVYVFDCMQR